MKRGRLKRYRYFLFEKKEANQSSRINDKNNLNNVKVLQLTKSI